MWPYVNECFTFCRFVNNQYVWLWTLFGDRWFSLYLIYKICNKYFLHPPGQEDQALSRIPSLLSRKWHAHPNFQEEAAQHMQKIQRRSICFIQWGCVILDCDFLLLKSSFRFIAAPLVEYPALLSRSPSANAQRSWPILWRIRKQIYSDIRLF